MSSPNELIQLVNTAVDLQQNWDRMTPAERDKGWWQVHKASRAVWNLIHPPHPNSFAVTKKTGKVE